ncbi:MAG: hypothetical protein NTW86_02590 [Candidatus Sumerlaeota bacterium]|nr:hypothetical protein [Candidatus Sumerlaeota bacterium]
MNRMAGILLALSVALAAGRCAAAVGVGIVQHDSRQSDNKVGRFLAEILPSAGMDFIWFSYDDLVDSNKLDPRRIQTLIVPESPFFPAVNADTLHRYLEKGGTLVALGGDPFSRPLFRQGGRWMEVQELASALRADPQSICLADPETMAADAWVPKRTNKQAPSAARLVSEDGRKAFLFEHRAVWDLDAFQLSVTPPPPRQAQGRRTEADALLFEARADDYTPQTAIRISNKKGESFEWIVELSPQWTSIFVPLQSFRPMGTGESAPPVSVHDISQIAFAMTEVRHARGDHDVYVRSLHGVKLPPGAFTPIETEGFVLCEDRDLYRFDDAVETVPAEAAPLPGSTGSPQGGFTASGRVSGISALGFPFFGESSYVPLLEARDRYGRRRGMAAGLVVNEAGRWKDSRWAVFGIQEPGWYLSKPFAQYVAELIRYMVEKKPAPSTLRQAQGRQAEAAPPTVVSRPKDSLPRITVRDGSFVRPDGSPFFAIGENISGNLFDRPFGKYDADALERLFRHLEEAGVNALRMQNVNTEADRGELNLLCDVAERHGVYLLVGATPYPREKRNTANDIRQYAAKLAGQLKDRAVVLGYDLANEPYIHQIGAYKNDAGQALRDVHGQDAANYRRYLDSIETAGGHTPDTMRGIDGVLQEPQDPAEAAAFRAVNGIYGDWISWFRDAFRAAGDTHPITVGYNMWYAAMPCNRALDFISQHAYVMPTGYDRVVGELGVLDSLHDCFPDKPVTFGEFGYTNGYILKGRPLSEQGQAVGEMMHFLKAWSKGYSGAFDWQVYDWDPVQYPRVATWNEDKWPFHNNYERFHGIYAWDGTPQGMLKPAGMAMRFLSEAIASGMDRGSLQIVKDETTQIGASYVFSAANALFVGATRHAGDGLSFDSGEERTVAMFWNAGAVTITSTGDLTVHLRPGALRGCAVKPGAPAQGKTGSTKWNGEDLEMLLLAGEPVTIGAPTK